MSNSDLSLIFILLGLVIFMTGVYLSFGVYALMIALGAFMYKVLGKGRV